MHDERKEPRINVRNALVERAVTSALSDAGYDAGRPSGMVISDRLPADVLVVGSSARSCREAVAAALRGDVQIALSEDEIDLIPAAIPLAAAGCAVVSRAVQAGADELKVLTERQIDVLAAVASGASNAEIAGRIFVSVPTVKREVAVLQATLGARTRAALVAIGHRHGFRAPLSVV